MEPNITELTLVEATADGWVRHGPVGFRIAPRPGEYVKFVDGLGIGQLYQVLALIHPLEHVAEGRDGDLLVRLVGTEVEYTHRLHGALFSGPDPHPAIADARRAAGPQDAEGDP